MPHLLVVDDNPGDIELFLLAVEDIGWTPRIQTAANGREAMHLLDAACSEGALPDLVVLDLNMPVMTGWEVLAQLKTHGGCGGLHRVVMTGSPRGSDCDRAFQLGAEDCYHKATDYGEALTLARAIRARVDGDQPPRTNR